jgi:hypothetical protein
MSENNNLPGPNSVKLGNTEPFNIMVVSPNKVQHLDWKSSTYLHDLVNGEYCKTFSIDPSKYIETIGDILSIEKQKHPVIDTKVISETYVSEKHNMIIEMMFVQHEDDGDGEELNEFAILLDVSDTKIYGTAILMCTLVANNDNDMHFIDITHEILEKMLYSRANTKVITYDADEEAYNEVEVFGPLDQFADDFFSENRYRIKKLELPFLKHNLNVWYTEDKYGTLDTFGNILPDTSRVDKMIVFSMWSEEYRHNLTMKEFEIIRFLSKKLEKYDVPDEYLNEERDEIGRVIIKNKYKILHKFYNMKK